MARELNRTRPQLQDEDEHPGGLEEFKGSSRVTKDTDLPLSKGWSSNQRPRSQAKAQAPRFTVPDDGEEVLIKFIEDEPFAPLFQHWIMTDSGRRAYTCLGFDTCPLCAKGDKAKSSDWINVVVLDDEPKLMVWYMSPDPMEAVKERAEGKRTSPIDKPGQYFAVSKKKGSNGFFSYSVDPVREDELKEDWGREPLTQAQLNEFVKNKFDSSIVRFHTLSELQEVARRHISDE